ncbi:cis-1,2-dihydro-1,2-dihydroxynaphthalene dehydrogenase [Teratosphaeria destructans]|uniref:Cis-1,2-dihydro-1,2-dihydroxynaphthalene dehydrogenase n=1 Tax=Teratosphaeria destructans TaxID=418781 RepID=A0A9W7STI0_9PEZI|nr:cis-1,2-dihydro-1,2-dihydroxynaphthalene dehydrogenase [Teratosphaeria destructans]
MPYSLQGRNVLVTGGSRGLGAVICQKFAAEGCNLAINYSTNEAPALALAESLRQKHREIQIVVLKGDAGVLTDCEHLVQATVQALGGLDGIIANAGWTKFTDFADLDALTEAEWDKCWATNVKGPHALTRAARPHFTANPAGGFCILTSSVAGKSLSGSSMAYSVTKAAQLHLMKCLARTQGPQIRINAVLPGLLLTEWGNRYGEERIREIRGAAALGRETDLEDCADAFVMLAKNTSMTGQNVHVDSGLVVQHL